MVTTESNLAAPRRIRPLRRVEYDRLVELGAFENEKIELLDGVLIAMSPQGVRHAVFLQHLDRALQRALGERAVVRVQMPVVASDTSEPEPDLAVVPDDDLLAHPRNAYLLVEVAESSLQYDLETKARIYARAGFPELWVIDVVARRAHVLRAPDSIQGRYTNVTEHAFEETLAIEAFPSVTVTPDALLPRR